jgi:hypothetical protein
VRAFFLLSFFDQLEFVYRTFLMIQKCNTTNMVLL